MRESSSVERVEGLAEYVEAAADALVPVSIAIHKGSEGRVYRYELLGDRAVRYSKQLSGASYGWDLFIEKVCWPHMAVPKDFFAGWKMQSAVGADDRPLVVLERTLVGGATERWYLNPERDHICQKNKVLDIGEAVFSLEVLEYDQTAGGQWYPAVLEKTEFAGENGTAKAVTLTRFIYPVERPGSADELFDPNMLPEAEQID